MIQWSNVRNWVVSGTSAFDLKIATSGLSPNGPIPVKPSKANIERFDPLLG